MREKHEESILFTIDVACNSCSCKREGVHAHRLLDGKTYVFFKENDCKDCGHRMDDHKFIRDTKSMFEKKRDSEI